MTAMAARLIIGHAPGVEGVVALVSLAWAAMALVTLAACLLAGEPGPARSDGPLVGPIRWSPRAMV